VVVIIKHAHTKTSRIHTRLGSVTKPPGPVTHGISRRILKDNKYSLLIVTEQKGMAEH
jgi:hypothetical protein